MIRLKKNFKLLFWLAVCSWLTLGISRAISTRSDQPAGALVITEFVTSNATGLTDEDGDYADWIEIYNQSNVTINLAGWALTDDPNDLQKWSFPDLPLASQAYLVVFASGKDRKSTIPGSSLHTNFRLNRAGEYLGLHNILDRQTSVITDTRFPQQVRDIAYGRLTNDSAFRYLAEPTPGQPNSGVKSWESLVASVDFSFERGFYDRPFNLELSTRTTGAAIRYTLDGSSPTQTHGLTYTGPIKIKATTAVRAAAFRPGYLSLLPTTHTYIFLDNVLTQKNAPPGFPVTWGTARRDIWEYAKGKPVPADYEMDPEIVNDPHYSQTIREGLHAIPSLSIVTEASNYDIYANPQERGIAWERPVSIELIYPQTGMITIQANAGLRIHGARGREEYIPKHSFRLSFRSLYGPARLNYPLFDDSPVAEFDTLILRGGVNRSYAGQLRSDKTGFELTTYTRDEWMRASQREMSGTGSHGIFVHLYLNGLYWGLYNLVERPDAAFMAAYFGGDKEDWFVMNANGPLDGPPETFETFKHALYSINELPEGNRYPTLQQRIDTRHFADYVILNWYAGTKDWPHNNWYAGVQLPQGQIRYFIWDGEVTWVDGARISLGDGDNTVKQFFETLIQYPDFRVEFADRLYKHLFNDGALTDASAQARWHRLNQIVERAIVGESARWGDTRYETPITPNDWRKARDAVIFQMEGNAARLIELAREAGYYPNTDPPLFNQHGGLVSPGFELTMQLPAANSEGTKQFILYTTDNTDPRLPGSDNISPSARAYVSPIVLTHTTHIKARTLVGEEWSALNEATFTATQEGPNLRITEIMYNPLGGSDYEFIELKNIGNVNANLSNLYFEGIDFTFPANTNLAAGDHLVLVSHPEAFGQRYPNVPIAGVYRGKLSNKGEKILLRDQAGQVITSVSYQEANGWPLTPDGLGDSLFLLRQDAAPDDPMSWRASTQLHGSPGADDPVAGQPFSRLSN